MDTYNNVYSLILYPILYLILLVGFQPILATRYMISQGLVVSSVPSKVFWHITDANISSVMQRSGIFGNFLIWKKKSILAKLLGEHTGVRGTSGLACIYTINSIMISHMSVPKKMPTHMAK